ncbi:MAG: RNA polymerase sigma factor [archaeon]|nr:RNA polymerase sigma factor [archaeon]
MQAISEETLRQAANGNMEAFEELYKASGDFVYGIAFRMTQSREDAQEIAQDVFLKVYRNLKNFEFRSSFKTWIYRIAMNTSINFLKRHSKQKAKTRALDDYQEAKAAVATFETGDSDIASQKVSKMLTYLSEDQRSCVVLRNIENLSYQEIAQTLNININTVRTRLKRAREKLIKLGKEVVQNEL